MTGPGDRVAPDELASTLAALEPIMVPEQAEAIRWILTILAEERPTDFREIAAKFLAEGHLQL